MKPRLFCTLLFCAFAYHCAIAQNADSLLVEKELKLLEKADKQFRKDKDISPIQYMQSTNLMQTPKGKSGLSMLLAECKIGLLRKMTKLGAPTTQTDSVRQEIYADFASAIKLCDECANLNRATRLAFLQKEKDTAFYETELAALKELGYPKSREGVSLGLSTAIGKDQWVGGSFAINEIYKPGSRFRYYKDPVSGETSIERYTTLKASMFNFEVMWNLNQKATDFNFSLLRIAAPFYLDITKFGATSYAKDPKAYWYYRPEIGIGWKMISAGYAFSYTFSKEKRALLERHLLFVKISYPFFNTK